MTTITVTPNTPIVGIDPSLTSTGICVIDTDGTITTHHVGTTGHTADSYRTRNQRILALAKQILTHTPPDSYVVIEGPSYKSVSTSTWDRAGLWHMIVCACIGNSCSISVVPPVVNKKFLTGTASASKQLMTATADCMLDRRLDTDDEADAFALALMGAHHLGFYQDEDRRSDLGVEWEEPAR